MKPSFDLLQSSKSIFTSEKIAGASLLLNEEEQGLQKALNVIIPTMLYGLAEKAATWYGASDIAQRATDAYKQGMLDDTATALAEGTGSYLFLLSDMFGRKSGEIIETIATYSGIKYPSVTALISAALPAILALIGKQKTKNDANSTWLAALLAYNKNSFANDLPEGIKLVEEEEHIAEEHLEQEEKKKLSAGWVSGIAMMLLSVIFFGWLILNKNQPDNSDIKKSEKLLNKSVRETTVSIPNNR
ncbi:DUF937 domain-containing protein [Ferruginibacter sp.]